MPVITLTKPNFSTRYFIKSLRDNSEGEQDSNSTWEFRRTRCERAKCPDGGVTCEKENAAVSRRAGSGRVDANGLPSDEPSRRPATGLDRAGPADKTTRRSSYPTCPLSERRAPWASCLIVGRYDTVGERNSAEVRPYVKWIYKNLYSPSIVVTVVN